LAQQPTLTELAGLGYESPGDSLCGIAVSALA
jgi:hypothetical protein